MKQTLTYSLLVLTLITGFSAVSALDEDDFTENLKNCSNYYENQSIILQEMKLNTVREIHGWQNGKCSYSETVSMADKNYTVNCRLSQDNINELVNIMNKFNNSAEKDKLDLNDYEQIQNSTVSTAWTKYLQNPDICSVELK